MIADAVEEPFGEAYETRKSDDAASVLLELLFVNLLLLLFETLLICFAKSAERDVRTDFC